MSKETLDFGNDKVGRLFAAMFIPTLIGMVFNSLLNICDGMFVGHGVGSDGLAAINIVAPLYLVCAGIGLMFGIGASVIGSIRLAENNVKGARLILTQAFITGSIIFGIVILVSLLFTDGVLGLLGCSDRLEPLASDYLLWILPGLVFLYLQCVGMMLIRLDGSPKYAMTVQIVAAILNIILDWMMVFPMGMGIKGAAIATSIACIVGGLMVLVYFLFFSDKLKFIRVNVGRSSVFKSLHDVGYMAKIGFATFIAEVAIGVTIITGNYVFMSRLGENGVAAYSIGCYLFPLIFSISNAVAQASQPIVSFNYGAGKTDRVKKALNIALTVASGCGVLISIGLWAGAPLLTRLFLEPDVPAYDMALHGLPLLGVCALFFAINITFIGYYQSIESAGRSIVFMLLRGIVFLIPGFILLPEMLGNDGLWLAIPVAEALTLLVIVAMYIVNRRKSCCQ